MRIAPLLLLGVLAGSCSHDRYEDRGRHGPRAVTRDAVLIDGTRVAVREDQATGQMVVVEPRNLSGMQVVVDPERRHSDELVVRPVGSGAPRDERRGGEGRYPDGSRGYPEPR